MWLCFSSQVLASSILGLPAWLGKILVSSWLSSAGSQPRPGVWGCLSTPSHCAASALGNAGDSVARIIWCLWEPETCDGTEATWCEHPVSQEWSQDAWQEWGTPQPCLGPARHSSILHRPKGEPVNIVNSAWSRALEEDVQFCLQLRCGEILHLG